MTPQTHTSPPASAPYDSRCQACGRVRPTAFVHYFETLGVIILRFMRQNKGNLCRDCAQFYFWEYTSNSFTLGWFGVVSALTNLVMIPQNVVRYARARAQLGPVSSAPRASLGQFVNVPVACPNCGSNDGVLCVPKRLSATKWLALGISAIAAIAGACSGVFALVTPTDTRLTGASLMLFLLFVLVSFALLTFPFVINVLAVTKLRKFDSCICGTCRFSWLSRRAHPSDQP